MDPMGLGFGCFWMVKYSKCRYINIPYMDAMGVESPQVAPLVAMDTTVFFFLARQRATTVLSKKKLTFFRC